MGREEERGGVLLLSAFPRAMLPPERSGEMAASPFVRGVHKAGSSIQPQAASVQESNRNIPKLEFVSSPCISVTCNFLIATHSWFVHLGWICGTHACSRLSRRPGAGRGELVERVAVLPWRFQHPASSRQRPEIYSSHPGSRIPANPMKTRDKRISTRHTFAYLHSLGVRQTSQANGTVPMGLIVVQEARRYKSWDSNLEQSQLPAFKRQKFLLDRQATSIACQPSVAPDNPVAGNNDGNGILAIGQTHRTDRLRLPDAISQLAVGDGLSVGDGEQILPNAELKRRALERERQTELFQFSPEVGLQLADGFLERCLVALPCSFCMDGSSAAGKADEVQTAIICCQQQRAYRTFKIRVVHLGHPISDGAGASVCLLGCKRSLALHAAEGARNVIKVISGGTPSRTGIPIVPSPRFT
jgi:hypothetical protein